MKTAIASLFLLLALSGVASSQISSCPSKNAYAVPIDTARGTVWVGTGGDSSDATNPPDGGKEYENTQQKKGQVTFEVVFWRVGKTNEASIAPGSIAFSGDPEAIDAMTTLELFDLMAQVAVAQGISAGYATCPYQCENNTFRVSVPACVTREGRGLETRFKDCAPGSCCVRTYGICCPDGDGTPVIRLVSAESDAGACGAAGEGCQSTCP